MQEVYGHASQPSFAIMKLNHKQHSRVDECSSAFVNFQLSSHARITQKTSGEAQYFLEIVLMFSVIVMGIYTIMSKAA